MLQSCGKLVGGISSNQPSQSLKMLNPPLGLQRNLWKKRSPLHPASSAFLSSVVRADRRSIDSLLQDFCGWTGGCAAYSPCYLIINALRSWTSNKGKWTSKHRELSAQGSGWFTAITSWQHRQSPLSPAPACNLNILRFGGGTHH